MLADIRQALRALTRNRGFSLVACLTLALGIGANDAMFSIADAALFRPLPYRAPDRLVDIFSQVPTRDGGSTFVPVNGSHAADLRSVSHVFEDVQAYRTSRPKPLAEASGPTPWVGAFTPGFPRLLGVSPRLGRVFDERDIGAADRIIISDGFWQRAFGRDPQVVGRTIRFADRPTTIVGVMPASFRYFVNFTDAWLPAADRDADRVVGRLRPGVTLVEAEHNLTAALRRPESPWHAGAIEIHPGDWRRGRPGTRTLLLCLLGASGLLLVIGCINVANMLLARTVARRREIGIRRALGASRLRLARPFLIEGLIVSGVGGAAAFALAWAIVRMIPAMMPGGLMLVVFDASLPQLDLRLLAFGCVAAAATGVLCGVAPSLRASRAPVLESLGAAGLGPGRATAGRRDAGGAFCALQVALTLVLLAGAGLLLSSLVRLVSVPTGYDASRLGIASLTLPRGHYPAGPARAALFEELCARIGALPGVTAVTVGPSPVGAILAMPMQPETGDRVAARTIDVMAYPVRPEYFRTVGIALKEGRTFGPDDEQSARPLTAIVSEGAARRCWPGQTAVGQRFRLFPDNPPLTVVGVVADTKTALLASDGVQTYLPVPLSRQDPTLVFRLAADGGPPRGTIMAAVRAVVQAAAPDAVIGRLTTADAQLAELDLTATARFSALVVGLLAALGLVTASVGLYGLLSYSVSRRTREIGVRVALGADAWRVRRLVVAEVLVPVVAGILGGLVASAWLSKYMATQLFRTAPTDPAAFASAALVFLVIAALAAFVPARRATRVDPAEALRAE